MEWKFSADKERYGNIIGEVIHHTLFEDGTITKYDVKFGNKTIKNIPTSMLEVVKTQEHMHNATMTLNWCLTACGIIYIRPIFLFFYYLYYKE